MNIKTIGDMKKDGKKQDGVNRQSYVGGEKSGLMVEDDIQDQIIRKAMEEAQK